MCKVVVALVFFTAIQSHASAFISAGPLPFSCLSSSRLLWNSRAQLPKSHWANAKGLAQALRCCAPQEPSRDADEQGSELPSPMALAKFALPTLAMRLATPLLSLVDTAVVGKFGTAEQLASLSPGTIACDSSAYILTFLGIATTNLYATALAQDRRDEAARVLNNSLSLAIICGTILGLVIYFGAPAFLSSFTGSSSGEVLMAARQFSEIRAVGAPAGILIMVAQALCFGVKDAVTPLKTVMLSFVVNLVGAFGLVYMLDSPITAVAVSTVVSQWLGACFILQRISQQQRALESSTIEQRPSLRRRLGIVRLELPRTSALRDFLLFAGPGFLALLGKVICYSSMTYAVTAAGTIALAAHQVLIQIFFFFCNIGDSISNTAQAFLPALWSRGDRAATRKVIKSIVLVGTIIGLADGALASLIPTFFASAFTSSLEVQACMQTVVWFLGASLTLHANVVALEGVLFAAREASYLAMAYAASTLVFTSAMVVVRKFHASLLTVWVALVLYQIVRLLQFGLKTQAISASPRTDASAPSADTGKL
jgi:putative MATE family efflux protein